MLRRSTDILVVIQSVQTGDATDNMYFDGLEKMLPEVSSPDLLYFKPTTNINIKMTRFKQIIEKSSYHEIVRALLVIAIILLAVSRLKR